MGIRTTVTLDEDVHERLKEESRKRGAPFRQTLNDVLRTGLLASRQQPPGRRFVIKPRRMGVRPGISYDSIPALLELGEGEGHR